MMRILVLTLSISSLFGLPATTINHPSESPCDTLRTVQDSLIDAGSMCADTMPKTECTTASVEVLKKCLHGIHIDQDCLEEVQMTLTEGPMDDKDCFCGGLVKFAEMLTSVEALLCGGEDEGEGRTGKVAAGDGDCYEDSWWSRLLGEFRKDDGQTMTPELCQRICFENNNFKFAGVQNAKECFCGNDEPPASKVMPRSHCNSPCSGNPHKMCGGSLRMNVYRNQDGDCYEDSSSRLLGELRKDDRQSMTPEMCQRICFVDNDFTYSGVQYFHECFCGNVEPPTTKLRTRSECDAPCTGDSDKMCGGSWRMNVYKNQDGACYEDNSSRLLGELQTDDHENMTPEECQRICFDVHNYQYAGVQYAHQCFCGDDEPPASKVMPRSECNRACTGNSAIMCGGSWRMNVYRNF